MTYYIDRMNDDSDLRLRKAREAEAEIHVAAGYATTEGDTP
jgi:hypothetical protein